MADRLVLDLTVETERPVVAIDAITYPLRTARDLSLQHYKFLERVAPRVGALMMREDLTPRESNELAGRLKEIAAMALDAPAAILAKLTDLQRVLIFKVFTDLLTPGLLRATRAIDPQEADRSHGPKPFPGSSASIQAARTKTGRRGRRSGSSELH